MLNLFNRTHSSRTVIIAVSFFWIFFTNFTFFNHVLKIYPPSLLNSISIFSLTIVLLSTTILILTLIVNRWIFKPFMIILLMVTASVAYFMDSYDIVVDTHMITNIMQTNFNESADLFSLKMVAYILFLGVLPSWIVYKLQITHLPYKKQIISDIKTVALIVVIVAATILTFSKFYTSFFREHKPLRYYANPSFCLYSVGKSVSDACSYESKELKLIGQDAKISSNDKNRKLIILVVGESARADHFSLNGYSRETNPLLKKEDIINFSDFTSCGTETAVSVPCMFSSFGRKEYEGKKALYTENVLDVFTHAGANVLWRDNNSDSKGVALRVPYEDFKLPKNNTMCSDGECRDEGMLVGLQKYIDAHPKGDIVIVLHQMGNHGPAYYKRYPKEFEKFTPVCKTNQLEQCTQAEITNAYDNVILYTDYFLSKVIGLLKQNDNSFGTAMFYVSDHGESLGENGLYLHGFPYAIAPDTQKHVPAVMWFGKQFKVNKDKLAKKAKESLSHDAYFHTALNLLDVNTTVYKPELSILNGIH
ncbi:phosphoethanolamine transferase [Sulfurimonas sp.]|uniref:phosphoethanolamine transferase n=1 Tax=Sulfurimonas sp. TaxID=2022749 RepID=UPI002616F320|nr:phosphoethanolamine--lipid A transferase [Sulfurimonas sp.]MDD5157529.1 phosphoethanolamine--lipid A transferase [Sulfurimonas sp.]